MLKIKSSTQAAIWIGSVNLSAKKRATAPKMHQGGLQAVFWPNWHAASLNTKPSITMPRRSLSQPPLHFEDVQQFKFTIAPIHDTSLGCPGPLDVMMGCLIGRSSPQHPAHSDKWSASEMSMEKWKSHRLSVLTVLLSWAAMVYVPVTPQSKYSLLSKRASMPVMRR